MSLARSRSLRPPPRSVARLNQCIAWALISVSAALVAATFFRTAPVERKYATSHKHPQHPSIIYSILLILRVSHWQFTGRFRLHFEQLLNTMQIISLPHWSQTIDYRLSHQQITESDDDQLLVWYPLHLHWHPCRAASFRLCTLYYTQAIADLPNCNLVKFADNTVPCSLVCGRSCLELNINKTKELIVTFSPKQRQMSETIRDGKPVEVVSE